MKSLENIQPKKCIIVSRGIWERRGLKRKPSNSERKEAALKMKNIISHVMIYPEGRAASEVCITKGERSRSLI